MPEIIDKISEEIKDLSKKRVKEISEEKIDIEEKINKKSETLWDKISNFFNKVDFLELSQEEKWEVAQKVKKDANPDKLYRIEIFLSGIIASLGLLQNSVAVIIGAMLIAPFLRPINGIAFGIARWERKFFINSVKVLFISSIVSIFMWFIVMNFTWLYKETPEILARTSPNIIDLFIAIFSAVVALLSLWYKRLWESVAWVAMAASLMPPLWVIWMELALWNYNLAWWALMLFITNIIAIILVWVWAFWLYGFTPNSWWKQKKSFIRIFLVVFLILLISVPLVKNLLFLKDKEFIEREINKNFSIILKDKIDNFSVWELSIKEISKEKAKIKISVKIKEWEKFYNDFESYAEKKLSEKIWREIELEIELWRMLKIISFEEEEKMLKELKNKNLENFKNKEKEEEEKSNRQVQYINSIKTDFEREINQKLEEEISIKLKKEIEEKLKEEIEEKLKEDFNILLEKKILEIQKNEENLSEETGSWKVDK